MEVQQQYGDQVRIVGVPGLSGSQEAMSEFVAQTGTEGIPHIIDDGVVWERFDVRRQRTYVIIDDGGEWRQTGYGSLAEDVQALIAG